MVQLEATLIGVYQRERRARDEVVHAEGRTEPLCESGLPGAEIASEQQEITGPGELRQRGRHGLGGLRRCGAHEDHPSALR